MAAKPKKRTAPGDKFRPFVFLHIGDLHITELPPPPRNAPRRREDQLEADLAAILADIESIRPNGGFDFVYLPGDLAENACRREYDRLTAALRRHVKIPVRLIPGDHDRARGTMDEFARFRRRLTRAQKQEAPKKDRCIEEPLGLSPCPPPDCLSYKPRPAEQYFFEASYRGVRCLFLDTVSAGYGQKGIGLDFRLGKGQFDWLSERVANAKASNSPCAIFMHCYPADMHEPGDAADVSGLIWNGGVRLVEMGHTHYNEIAHDGRTQYATARSVGQNEDGPVGFAVVALDDKVTSWRFKQLQQTWPFVMITSPADRRLATEALHVVGGKIVVRALILSDQDELWHGERVIVCDDECERHPGDDDEAYRTVRYRAWCSVDHGAWEPMTYLGDSMFQIEVDWHPGSRKVSVNVQDGRWGSRMKDFIDVDTIEPAASGVDFKLPDKPERPGSGSFHVGAWPEKGIRGDQLGPNSGGRKW